MSGAKEFPAGREYQFVDVSRHGDFLCALLAAGALLAAVAVVTGYFERQLYLELEAGIGLDDNAIVARAEASDYRQFIVGWLQIATSIATVICFAWWILRTSRNAHVLAGKPLRITPGWSLGWYFVPIANIWKPFQAMRQTWNASQDPSKDIERPAVWLVWVWWLLFLVESSIGRAAFRLTLRAEELPQLITANVVTLVDDAITMPLNVAAFFLVARISQMQAKKV